MISTTTIGFASGVLRALHGYVEVGRELFIRRSTQLIVTASWLFSLGRIFVRRMGSRAGEKQRESFFGCDAPKRKSIFDPASEIVAGPTEINARLRIDGVDKARHFSLTIHHRSGTFF